MKRENVFVLVISIVIVLGALLMAGFESTGRAIIEEPELVYPEHDGYIVHYKDNDFGIDDYVVDDDSDFLKASDDHATYGGYENVHRTARAFFKFDLTGKDWSGLYLNLNLVSAEGNVGDSYCPILSKINDYGDLDESDFDPQTGVYDLVNAKDCNEDLRIDLSDKISRSTGEISFMMKRNNGLFDMLTYGSSESGNKPYLELEKETYPSMPTNFEAMPGPETGDITLSWDENPYADYYYMIWVKWGEGGHHVIPEIIGNKIIRSIPEYENAPYGFRLGACNQYGCGEFTSLISQNPKIEANANGPYNSEDGKVNLVATAYHIKSKYLGGHSYKWEIDGLDCTPSMIEGIFPNVGGYVLSQKVDETTCVGGTGTATLTVKALQNFPEGHFVSEYSTVQISNDTSTDSAEILVGYDVLGEGVEETITCVFRNSTGMAQSCYAEGFDYICSEGPDDSCSVEVSEEDGTEMNWRSSCSGERGTVVDGVDEQVVFDCDSALTPGGTNAECSGDPDCGVNETCEEGICVLVEVSGDGDDGCPQWVSPAPGWCDDGEVIPGEVDEDGCRRPPSCDRLEDVNPFVEFFTYEETVPGGQDANGNVLNVQVRKLDQTKALVFFFVLVFVIVLAIAGITRFLIKRKRSERR